MIAIQVMQVPRRAGGLLQMPSSEALVHFEKWPSAYQEPKNNK
jgi:hypothetical protein